MKRQLKKIDENLRNSIKLQIEAVPSARMLESENYIIYSIGVESTDPHLNGALCLNDAYAKEMLQKAKSFFTELDLDYTVWVRDHADVNLEQLLIDRGLTPNRTPGSAVMIREERLNQNEVPAGFRVEQVTNRKQMDGFAEVIELAFDKTPMLIDKMFETEPTLIHDNIVANVIYNENTPVSAVMTVLSKDTAGIYWVGTIESARGQGLGSLITQVGTNVGFDKGKNLVLLQASELGERIYKKLGYQTVTHYRTYTLRNI